jgi:hypothetical protein
MPRYMVTLFGLHGNAGWSEVYPVTAATPAAAQVVLANLLTLRLHLMTADSSINGARISDTDIKNDSWPTLLALPQVGTYVPGIGTPTTYNPQIAMRILQLAGGLVRGSRWLRALPIEVMNASGVFVGSVGWSPNLTAYLDALVGSISIATKIRGAIVPPFYTFTAITSATQRGAEKRNIGRPFGLPHGRRLIA